MTLWTRSNETNQKGTILDGQPQIVVIGYGNALRRDDGAGLVLAQTIVAAWEAAGQPARLLAETQLLPEMAEVIASEEVAAVVFVDASAKVDSVCIEISEIDLDLPAPSTGHQLYPATLLVYAALLNERYPRAWSVTIPAFDFAHGEGFSPAVNQMLEKSAATAHELLLLIKDALPCMN